MFGVWVAFSANIGKLAKGSSVINTCIKRLMNSYNRNAWVQSLELGLRLGPSWKKILLILLIHFVNYSRLPPNHPVRLMNWVTFFMFAVVVPFVYLRIFYWRYHHKAAGICELERKFRKHRNFASMWYNMALWAIEVTAAGLMVGFMRYAFN